MSHGHDDHGHASATETSHGPAEFPPMPDPRSISPAREDFQAPWPGKLLVWPFLWTVVALLFFVAARSWGHKIGEHDVEAHEAGHAGEAPHEGGAPHGESESHGGEPAMAGEGR